MIVARGWKTAAFKKTFHMLAASLVISAGAMSAIAADAPKDSELLRDYVHYVRIARYDLALSNAQALLDKLVPPFGKAEASKGGLTPEQFVKLVDAGDVQRFEESTARGSRVGEIESVSSRLLAAYEQGKRDNARAAANITKNIQLLVGTSRQRLVGRERLIAAGEYALPQLLATLAANTDLALSAEVRAVVIDLGKQSVMPLAAALPNAEPKLQETIASILGDIKYKSALPFLYELAIDDKANAAARKAAQLAIARIDAGYDKGMQPSILFEQLANGYLEELDSLTSFPGEPVQVLWQHSRAGGLTAVPVKTEVFHETMAMRLAEHALKLDPTNRQATALWIAANFGREFSSPKDYKHPVYADYRDAMYYAVTAGPSITQRVLDRALKTRNTALALKSIAAIETTAGAAALANAEQGRPLLDAIRYPNRRVQNEAALALGAAQPQSTFEGSDRVVPILAGAVRDAGARYAVVLSANAETANSIAGVLRAAGFTVLSPGKSFAEIAEPVASAPGVDLIVTALPGNSTAEAIDQARNSSRLLATPVVAIVSDIAEPELRIAYGRNPTIAIVREGSNPQQIAEATNLLLKRNAGEALSAEETASYQTRALTVLRELAIANNPVFNVGDATYPLTAALESAKGKLREQVAEVLSRIGSKKAQMAIADAAIGAEGEEMLILVGKLTGSAKRFGNMLDDRQLRRFTDLAGKGSDEQATAISALIGALNIPNGALLPLLSPAAKQ